MNLDTLPPIAAFGYLMGRSRSRRERLMDYARNTGELPLRRHYVREARAAHCAVMLSLKNIRLLTP